MEQALIAKTLNRNPEKTIKNILDNIPARYTEVVKHIYENDFEDLLEYCKTHYSPTIRKIMAGLLYQRIREKSQYVDLAEISKYCNTDKKKVVMQLAKLKLSGFNFKTIDNNKLVKHSILTQFNILQVENRRKIEDKKINNIMNRLMNDLKELRTLKLHKDKILAILIYKKIDPRIDLRKL